MTINIKDDILKYYLSVSLQKAVKHNVNFKFYLLGEFETVIEVCEVKYIKLTDNVLELSIFCKGVTFPKKASQFSLKGGLLVKGIISFLESEEWMQPLLKIKEIISKEPLRACLGSRKINLHRAALWLVRWKKGDLEDIINRRLVEELSPESIEKKLEVRSALGQYKGMTLSLLKLETQLQNLEIKTGLLQLQLAAFMTLELGEIKPDLRPKTKVSKVRIPPSAGKLTLEMTHAEFITLLNENIEVVNDLLPSKKLQLKHIDILGTETDMLVFRICLNKPLSEVLELRCQFVLDQSRQELILQELDISSSEKTNALTKGLVWLASGTIERSLRKLFPISLELAMPQLNSLLKQNDWGFLKWKGELIGVESFETLHSLLVRFSTKSIWSVKNLEN